MRIRYPLVRNQRLRMITKKHTACISAIAICIWIAIGMFTLAAPLQSSAAESKSEELIKENEELRKRLAEFELLKEDQIAKRVFDKSKSYLFSWITFGGIILTISGLIGIKALKDYVAELAKKKLESVTQEFLKEKIEEEGKKQVTVVISRQIEELDAYAKRTIEQVVMASKPIKALSSQSFSELGTQLDYSNEIHLIRDCGAEGSVVGQALATALEFQIFKAIGKRIQVSARHIYYLARKKGGIGTNNDTGAFIKDGVAMLSTEGVVEEHIWPYHAGDYAKKPPKEVAQASRFRIKEAILLDSLEDIKRALRDYGSVVTGLTMFNTALTADVAKTGILPLPKRKDQIRGGHAVCIVGYDDTTKCLKFANSWGSGWGDKGFGYLPYDYVTKHASDIWTFKYAKGAESNHTEEIT